MSPFRLLPTNYKCLFFASLLCTCILFLQFSPAKFELHLLHLLCNPTAFWTNATFFFFFLSNVCVPDFADIIMNLQYQCPFAGYVSTGSLVLHVKFDR